MDEKLFDEIFYKTIEIFKNKKIIEHKAENVIKIINDAHKTLDFCKNNKLDVNKLFDLIYVIYNASIFTKEDANSLNIDNLKKYKHFLFEIRNLLYTIIDDILKQTTNIIDNSIILNETFSKSLNNMSKEELINIIMKNK